MKEVSKIIFILFLIFSFGIVGAQYYYFSPVSEYNQWCEEKMEIHVNTESSLTWMTAWICLIKMDDGHFIYETWSSSALLRANLYDASTAVFEWYSTLELPVRWSQQSGVLYVDMSSTATNYLWSNWLYWTLKEITPRYSVNEYTWYFSFVYNWWTSQTLLGYGYWNSINSSSQDTYLTWETYVYQKPCDPDDTAPQIVDINYWSVTTMVVNDGLDITLGC